MTVFYLIREGEIDPDDGLLSSHGVQQNLNLARRFKAEGVQFTHFVSGKTAPAETTALTIKYMQESHQHLTKTSQLKKAVQNWQDITGDEIVAVVGKKEAILETLEDILHIPQEFAKEIALDPSSVSVLKRDATGKWSADMIADQSHFKARL